MYTKYDNIRSWCMLARELYLKIELWVSRPAELPREPLSGRVEQWRSH